MKSLPKIQTYDDNHCEITLLLYTTFWSQTTRALNSLVRVETLNILLLSSLSRWFCEIAAKASVPTRVYMRHQVYDNPQVIVLSIILFGVLLPLVWNSSGDKSTRKLLRKNFQMFLHNMGRYVKNIMIKIKTALFFFVLYTFFFFFANNVV